MKGRIVPMLLEKRENSVAVGEAATAILEVGNRRPWSRRIEAVSTPISKKKRQIFAYHCQRRLRDVSSVEIFDGPRADQPSAADDQNSVHPDEPNPPIFYALKPPCRKPEITIGGSRGSPCWPRTHTGSALRLRVRQTLGKICWNRFGTCAT
jgi:hypothetical protein